MIKEIVTDKKELSKKSRQCFFNDFEIRKNKRIATDLFETANFHRKNCIGLAANQIGSDKRIIFVKNPNEDEGKFGGTMMVNPVLHPSMIHGKTRKKEFCLSFPGKPGVKMKRYKRVSVTYQLLTGRTIKKAFKGKESRVVQHEIDHLNGLVI